MTGFVVPIEAVTVENSDFRRVLVTASYMQLVAMCLRPGEDIGDEVHASVDQFFRIEQGEALVVFKEKEEHRVRDGDAIVVPAGTWHNVINTSTTKLLRLYTLYSPPNHPAGTVHPTQSRCNCGRNEGTLIRGYTKPLYILPFDHRASFVSGMFDWTGTLGAEQVARITAAKRVIYEGFCAAVAGGVQKDRAGILVDESFGSDILRDARAKGVVTCLPAEKSGQDEFDFEFGEQFARHIEKFAPTFCKVLVRYNTEGDAATNSRQAARLRRLSEYLEYSPFKFMFELLVPATRTQLNDVRADPRAYDQELRPALMGRAIRELQDFGVEPDVWKVEGLDRREDCEGIAAMATRDGRDNVRCIVLGRAEQEQHVREWLATAATVRGFIGFAVGRTTFWDPLIALRDETITRTAAVAEIARRFRRLVDLFEQTRSATNHSDLSPPVWQPWASPAHNEQQQEGSTS